MNAMTAHPKLVTIAIGFGVTMAVGTAIGVVYAHSALARVQDQNTLVIPT